MSEQVFLSLFPNRPRCVISIQARLESRRLPRKVLAQVMGRPLLAWQVERLARGEWPVVVAVPQREYATFAEILGSKVFWGSAEDVPFRHLTVAFMTGADVIGFCGGDQTLVSPEHFEAAFRQFQRRDPPDYVRIVGLPHGLHVWAVSRAALEACVMDDKRDADEIEHTGAYWDRRPDRFRTMDIDMGLASDYRLTVDTPEDLEVHRRLMEELGAENVATATVEQMLAILDAHPEWSHLNAGVSQYYWTGAPREGVKV